MPRHGALLREYYAAGGLPGTAVAALYPTGTASTSGNGKPCAYGARCGGLPRRSRGTDQICQSEFAAPFVNYLKPRLRFAQSPDRPHMQTAIHKLPARPPTPDERAVLAEWLAAAGDIALAYVSSRQSDDLAVKHRITVISEAGGGMSHLVFAPAGRDIWIVLAKGQRTRLRRHKTLRAALNSIRRVLVDVEPVSSPEQITQE